MADWIASNQSYAPLILSDDKGIYITYPKRVEKICELLFYG